MVSIRFFKRMALALTCVILASGLLVLPVFANQPEPPPGYFILPPYQLPAKPTILDKQLLSIMEQYKIVGLSAVVFKNNKLVWSNGYGWSNLKPCRPVTSDTLFRVASLSKMVTATALMQLYEQRKFDLDDDISNYLGYKVRNPHFPNIKITFRQLLTHTSSITDYGAYDSIVEETPELLPVIDIKDMLVPGGQYYTPQTFADYAPGSQFSYSNFGTGIVGSLVEKISGMPFDKYCSKYIFNPLKMDASFEPADLKNWQNIAVLYRPDEHLTSFRPTKDDFQGCKPKPAALSAPLGSALGRSPAGGLRTSSTDLSKFMQAHMNGGRYNRTRILNADTADLMHSMQWFGNSMDGFYKQKGLNFHITDDLVPGKRLVGHSGEAYGLSSDAYYDPDSKFGVVFMLNGGNLTNATPYYSVENAIAKTLFDSFAPKVTGTTKKIRAKANAAYIMVNGRKILLPAPAAVVKTGQTQNLFLPAISAADALGVNLEQTYETYTYKYGQNKAAITVGQAVILVNGKKIAIAKAPYKQQDTVLVPIQDLASALKVDIKLSF